MARRITLPALPQSAGFEVWGLGVGVGVQGVGGPVGVGRAADQNPAKVQLLMTQRFMSETTLFCA